MTQRKKRRGSMKVGRDGIPLRFYIPDDLPLHHVDQMNVVHVGGFFYVSFLQVQMPLILDEGEFGKIKEIPSKCVARLILNEETLERSIDVLSKHLKKVRDRAKEAEADHGDAEEETASDILPDSDTTD
jgi:hypothetical protein